MMNDKEIFLKKPDSPESTNKSSVIHRLISKTSKTAKKSEITIDDTENANTNNSTNSTEFLDLAPLGLHEKNDDFIKKTLCTQSNKFIFFIMMIFLVILLGLLCMIL